MGTCIICGTPTDGRVCESHQEDVAFEFRGDRPDQLVAGRYYEGEVDGFADFGVFVNIGDRVTGLLHRSEIEGRLESLDWDPGDEVYVQVLEVHNNGNVDLGWSIRQSPREFRGELVHDPSSDEESEFEPTEAAPASGPGTGSGPVDRRDPGADTGSAVEETTPPDERREPEPAEHVRVESLDDRVGERVRLEGEIVSVRQTGGPTIFELRDETGTVDCAAFLEAGERAYPEVDPGSVVSLTGDVERHRGELQIETADIESLEAERRETVSDRLSDALDERATAPGEELLVPDETVETIREELRATATALRRAVIDGRPVVVRHAASVDGYVAGAALERALGGLVREVHDQADAEYRYLERRPLPEDVYGMRAATDDVTEMLDASERHEESTPLFVFAGAGETAESIEGFELLGAYDAERILIAAGSPADVVSDALERAVGVPNRTAGTLAAHVAALVAPDLVDDLAHLPAISYWTDVPTRYRQLAVEGPHEESDLSNVREALALQAYYQSWEDKRELVRDLFWSPEARALAADLSDQFENRLSDELDTARPHLQRHDTGAGSVRILDVNAHTHRFDFPPTPVLLDELHRRAEDDAIATIGIDTDDLRLRAGSGLEVDAVASALGDRLPEAGIRVRNGRRGRIEFLKGERDAVEAAVIEVIGDLVADASGESAPSANVEDDPVDHPQISEN